MNVISKRVQRNENDPEYVFFCPGCQYGHWFKTTGDSPRWSFNQDLEKPTVEPSILVRGTFICHSFVRNGAIEFLSDSSHALAGKTVNLEPIESIE